MWEMQALSTTTQNQNLDPNNSLLTGTNSICTSSSSDENGIVSETDSASAVTDCSTTLGCTVGGNGGGSGLNSGHSGGLLSSTNNIINSVDSDLSSLNNNSQLVQNFEMNTTGSMQIDVLQQQQHQAQHQLQIKHPRTNSILPINGCTTTPSIMSLQNDTDPETLFLDASGNIMHPALRGIKAVNIGRCLLRYYRFRFLNILY